MKKKKFGWITFQNFQYFIVTLKFRYIYEFWIQQPSWIHEFGFSNQHNVCLFGLACYMIVSCWFEHRAMISEMHALF